MGRPRFFSTLNILPPADPAERTSLRNRGLDRKHCPTCHRLGEANENNCPVDGTALVFLDLELSVCAMGPVKPGERIIAMRVWVWQEADTTDIAEHHEHGAARAGALERPDADTTTVAAASAGNGGVHLGGHPIFRNLQDLPFKGPTWMIQTLLEPHSQQFTVGKPALATAMALVDCDGTREVQHWSQGVLIGQHERHQAAY